MQKFLKEAKPYIITIIIVLLTKTYIVAPIKVNGKSMINTLEDGDIMLLNKLTYRFNEIKRFDIIVLKATKEDFVYKGEFLVKRIIGLPGEKIEYKNDTLYVNGKKVEDNHGNDKTPDYNIKDLGSTTVPEDSYFVLGDNRVNSMDSGVLGFIKKKDIVGKAQFTVLPISRFGEKK